MKKASLVSALVLSSCASTTINGVQLDRDDIMFGVASAVVVGAAICILTDDDPHKDTPKYNPGEVGPKAPVGTDYGT